MKRKAFFVAEVSHILGWNFCMHAMASFRFCKAKRACILKLIYWGRIFGLTEYNSQFFRFTLGVNNGSNSDFSCVWLIIYRFCFVLRSWLSRMRFAISTRLCKLLHLYYTQWNFGFTEWTCRGLNTNWFIVQMRTDKMKHFQALTVFPKF